MGDTSRRSLAFAALLAVWACTDTSKKPAAPEPYNLVLISLDTLRADHLGCYGYPRATSPHLDALAARSVLFERAYSSSSKTAESHMSMFTSLQPSVHQVQTQTIDRDTVIKTTLDAGIQTLPEILRTNGYTTVGFHGGGNVAPALGFDRGFDHYRRAELRSAMKWLQTRNPSQKFFLFYHTYRVHDPYTPRPPYDSRFTNPNYSGKIVHNRAEIMRLSGKQGWAGNAKTYWELVDEDDPADVQHLIDLYDGAIAHLDDQLAHFFRLIETVAPRTIIIVLSDHGEEFREHGEFKHRQLYREVLHVPLIVRHPDMPPRRLSTPVSLIDLAPTVLALLSLPTHEQFQGRSLSRTLAPIDGDIFSELPQGRMRALRRQHHKVIDDDGELAFFDLATDPQELHRLDAEGRAELAPVLERLRRIEVDNTSVQSRLNQHPITRTPSKRTIKELEALGYVR